MFFICVQTSLVIQALCATVLFVSSRSAFFFFTTYLNICFAMVKVWLGLGTKIVLLVSVRLWFVPTLQWPCQSFCTF